MPLLEYILPKVNSIPKRSLILLKESSLYFYRKIFYSLALSKKVENFASIINLCLVSASYKPTLKALVKMHKLVPNDSYI